MGRGNRTPSYFAVTRDSFTDPLFNYGQPRYSRWEAWQWMVAQAAYKPKGQRHLLGIADLERGQLTASLREMALAWRWPLTTTHRFLHRLVHEGRIGLAHVAVGQDGTRNGTRHGHTRHIITICNYDETQSKPRKAEHGTEHGLEDGTPYIPGIIHEVAGQQEQPTQKVIESERVGRHDLRVVNNGDNSSTTQWKDKPPHGAKDRRTGKWQWFDHPSAEWTQAERLHRADKGTRLFPKIYKGGRGNWFKVRSETEIKLLYQRICDHEGIATREELTRRMLASRNANPLSLASPSRTPNVGLLPAPKQRN
jgi:hypothetical protein